MSKPVSGSVPQLRLDDVVKDFPGVRALDGVDLEIREGEIHAIVGENGSGKSTTVKIISGVLAPDAGSIYLGDEEMHFTAPSEALRRGIATVYQEVNLVPLLPVGRNLTLGLERVRPDASPDEVLSRGQQVLHALGAAFRLSDRVVELDHAGRQFVQIARAIAMASRVLVLDEPTEGLSVPQFLSLQALLKDLRSEGTGIIYVSHRLQEVMDIADRISVLRDGTRVGTVVRADASREDLIRMMVGRMPEERAGRQSTRAVDGPVLSVTNIGRSGFFSDISLQVRAGEIVGLAGVPGSRKAELLRAICGADTYDEGRVEFNGVSCPPASPAAAVDMGIVFLPADRKEEGLVLPASVRTNVILPHVEGLQRFGLRRRGREMEVSRQYVQRLAIRTRSIETPTRNLSGGNQQKVLFARVLHAGASAVLLDEPTQGVDIAGKAEIHALIHDLAAEGAAVLVASSEMDELIKVCHRILVIRLGKLVGEFSSGEADPQTILQLALP